MTNNTLLVFQWDLWCAAGGASLAAALVTWTALRVRLHVRQQRILARFAPPQALGGEAAGAQDGVALAGVLRAGPGLCWRFEDGGAAAAATITPQPRRRRGLWHLPASATAQASPLILENGAQQVALESPVEVVTGSTEARLRKPLVYAPPVYQRAQQTVPAGELEGLSREKVSLRSVRDGDRVVVQGRLTPRGATDGASCYRSSAHRWVLSAGEGRLQMAFCGRLPFRLFLAPALAAALAAAALVGPGMFFAGKDNHTESLRLFGAPSLAYLGLLAANRCKESVACQFFGQCTAVRNGAWASPGYRCVNGSSGECRRSLNCKIHQQCRPDGAWCN